MMNYFKITNSNSKGIVNNFKRFLKKAENSNVFVDLSSLNILDTVKFVLLFSPFYYQKFPYGKLKYHLASDDIKEYVSLFAGRNLEFI